MQSSLSVASSQLSAYVQPISGILPSIMSVRRRGLLTWKSVALLVVLMVVSSEAQTFQYSRGWTNGKRNGGMSVSPYEAVESGLVGVGVDPMDMIIPPGHLQMNLVPQGRFRSLDYNQFLTKRMALAGPGNYNIRKQPLWFGTILGVDGTDSSQSTGGPVASVGNPVSSSNTNTVSSSRSSTADF